MICKGFGRHRNNVILLLGPSDQESHPCIILEDMDKLHIFSFALNNLLMGWSSWSPTLLVITTLWSGPVGTHTHTYTHRPEFTVHLYLLNSCSNKIKLARWNPTFVLSDGGMKWDSINTCSPIGLAGWLPTEAELKRLGAAIMQVELQRRWGWGGDDSALITGSEQGVISCGREREREGRRGVGEVDWLPERR